MKMLRLREGAGRVVSTLRDAGYEAYLAGGCVRDQLLGLEPKDYDVVTNARPDEVSALFAQTVHVGVAFGVVRVRLGRGLEFEVATYRQDGRYSDGRHPDEVRYAQSAREDVERRDFTVNALLYDPVEGRVLDWVGGESDLRAGLIRAVGHPEERFREDRLRMLRAVRFAARLGFAIEDRTRAAIILHAPGLGAVSVERVVQELDGIFLSARPREALSLLEDTGLLPYALPATSAYRDAERLRWAERLERLPGAALRAEERLDVAWAAAFAPLEAVDVESVLRALKHARARLRGVARVQHTAREIADAARPGDAVVMRVAAGSDAGAWVEALRVWEGDQGAGLRRLAAAVADVAARPLPGRPLVKGADLRALGLKPGPAFKRILSAVDDAVLERRVTDRDAALRLVRTLAGT